MGAPSFSYSGRLPNDPTQRARVLGAVQSGFGPLANDPLIAAGFASLNTPTPPLPPDPTDEAVRRARLAASQRAQVGQGIDSTFLTGPMGLPNAPRP